MSDFLTRLAQRQLGQIASVEPRVPELYAPVTAAHAATDCRSAPDGGIRFATNWPSANAGGGAEFSAKRNRCGL